MDSDHSLGRGSIWTVAIPNHRSPVEKPHPVHVLKRLARHPSPQVRRRTISAFWRLMSSLLDLSEESNASQGAGKGPPPSQSLMGPTVPQGRTMRS